MTDYEVRYLDITWSDRDTVLRLEASQDSIEIHKTSAGIYVETITFPNVYHYIGFCVKGDHIKHTPYFELSEGNRKELTPVNVPSSDEVWWIQRDKWDKKGKRYYSSLFRTAGRATLVIEGDRLTIENNTFNFSVKELEYYLADFKNSLWMLILDNSSVAKANINGEIPDCFSDEVLVLFDKYVQAVEKVIRKPNVSLVESQGKLPRRSVRPVPRTFREVVTQPFVKNLTSRIYLESNNTAENRFIYYTIERVLYIINSLCRLALAKSTSLEKKIKRELTWKDLKENIATKKIDSRVYDSEISTLEIICRELNEGCDSLVSESSSRDVFMGREYNGTYRLKFGRQYGCSLDEFFCDLLDGVDIQKKYKKYLVVKLPESASKFVAKTSSKDVEFVLTGKYTKSIRTNNNGKEYYFIEYLHIVKARIKSYSVSKELSRLVHKRKKLEGVNWIVPLTPEDIAERKMDIMVVARKLEVYEELHRYMAGFIAQASAISRRLRKAACFFKNNSVKSSAIYPNSMTFIQNSSYCKVKSSFQAISELNGLNKNILDSLIAVDEIGLVNVSNLYEKWCLLKIIALLKNIFGFALDGDWQSSLVSSVLKRQCNIELFLTSHARGQSIVLTYEKELVSRVRPDYVLDLTSKIYGEGGRNGEQGLSVLEEIRCRFVLDAKFRGAISAQKITELVRELCCEKDYSEGGANKVFVIHPSPDVIDARTSPLDWGGDCDYGQSHRISHRYGSVFMSPSLTKYGSVDNLQRLLGMFFQECSVIVKDDSNVALWTNMVCVSCGSSHETGLRLTYSATEKGSDRWIVECRVCTLLTVKTICFNCGCTLFKNGVKWTYHRTRAEQISNVLCPECETFLVLCE